MRRLFWLGVGAVAGASGTVWTERKVRQRLDTLQPDHLVLVAADRARTAGRTVVEAVSEGRGAMREREEQLRSRLDRPTGDGASGGRRGALRDSPAPNGRR